MSAEYNRIQSTQEKIQSAQGKLDELQGSSSASSRIRKSGLYAVLNVNIGEMVNIVFLCVFLTLSIAVLAIILSKPT